MGSLAHDVARLIHTHNPERGSTSWKKLSREQQAAYQEASRLILNYLMDKAQEPTRKIPEGKIAVRGYFRKKGTTQ